MDYYGLLFLYYLKGLSGKSVLRLFFNIEAGGTEQLLPENTSAPTTSPILADIQYPDGLRTDQYFTYRETPTTISNKARIKTIKGNTLVWNQLADNSHAPTSRNGITITHDDNTFTLDGTCTQSTTASGWFGLPNEKAQLLANHVLFVAFKKLSGTSSSNTSPNFRPIGRAPNLYLGSEGIYKYSSASASTLSIDTGVTYTNLVCQIQLFDLTAMFGSTKADEIYAMEQSSSGSGVAYFRSLFPLSYYPYNTGSLLSFNGTGIKTVGFNQWDEEWEAGSINATSGNNESNSTLCRSKNFTDVIPNGQYYFKLPTNGTIYLRQYDANGNYLGYNHGLINQILTSRVLTLPSDTRKIKIVFSGTTYNNDICINISSSRNGEYEPYTENTTTLPIQTYFPTGMKSAGSVYDELTPTKAITRMGTILIDGSSVTAVGATSTGVKYARANSPIDSISGSLNIKSVPYLPINTAPTSSGYIRFQSTDMYIYDNAFTDLATARSILNANPVTVYYELATPTETPITTEDANEALSLLMGKSVSSSNANQLIDIITKGE